MVSQKFILVGKNSFLSQNFSNFLISKKINFLKIGFKKFLNLNDKKINNYSAVLNFSTNKRFYNFEKKTIKNVYNETKDIDFLIVEGIFAKEFSRTLNNHNYFFLELKINKKECMKRVLRRDHKERGKSKKQAENDFLKSWDIYYEKTKNKKNNKIKKIKKIKKIENEYIITKKTNIDQLLTKLFN